MVNNAYWDALLSEYVNKHNKNHAFLYSNYGVKIEKELEKIIGTKKTAQLKQLLPVTKK